MHINLNDVFDKCRGDRRWCRVNAKTVPCRQVVCDRNVRGGEGGSQICSNERLKGAITTIDFVKLDAAIIMKDLGKPTLWTFSQEYVVFNCNGMYLARAGHDRH